MKLQNHLQTLPILDLLQPTITAKMLMVNINKFEPMRCITFYIMVIKEKSGSQTQLINQYFSLIRNFTYFI